MVKLPHTPEQGFGGSRYRQVCAAPVLPFAATMKPLRRAGSAAPDVNESGYKTPRTEYQDQGCNQGRALQLHQIDRRPGRICLLRSAVCLQPVAIAPACPR